MKKQIWARRVAVFEYIFSCLAKNEQDPKAIINELKTFPDIDLWQIKIVTYFSYNLNKTIAKIQSLTTKSKWSYEQMDLILKAIIHEVYNERLAHQTDKAILIDQSLITMDHYGEPKLKKILHAIIDKIIE